MDNMIGIKCNKCGHTKRLSKDETSFFRFRYGFYDESDFVVLERIIFKFKCTKCGAKEARVLNHMI